MNGRTTIGWSIAILLVALLATACTGAATPTSTGPVEVQVTLSEFKIESSVTKFSVGVPYRFVVTNKGAIVHELMITPTGMGQMSMEDMHQKALVEIEEADLPPGATKTLDFSFTEPAPAGTLEFSCYVPGHYEAGMKLPIMVK